MSGRARNLVVAFIVCWLWVGTAWAAADRYALVVSGASGGPQYAQKYDGWRSSLVDTLRRVLGYPEDHIIVLAEQEGEGSLQATRDNVREAVSRLRARATKDDVVTIVLIGHGTVSDAEDAKFNLVGPDLTAADWAALLKPMPGRLVFIDTTSGSFPFLHHLAGPGRVVVTANDSAAQQFETVFPEYFIKAFEDDQADSDKSGRVSVWEAFAYASQGVARWFEERGQLATERPLLDDSGDGIGREAVQVQTTDGIAAQTVYLRRDPPIAETADAALNSLLRRRAALDAELDGLKARRPVLTPEEYERALEKLLIEIAQLDRQIRSRS